jgi:hypothetical protein
LIKENNQLYLTTDEYETKIKDSRLNSPISPDLFDKLNSMYLNKNIEFGVGKGPSLADCRLKWIMFLRQFYGITVSTSRMDIIDIIACIIGINHAQYGFRASDNIPNILITIPSGGEKSELLIYGCSLQMWTMTKSKRITIYSMFSSYVNIIQKCMTKWNMKGHMAKANVFKDKSPSIAWRLSFWVRSVRDKLSSEDIKKLEFRKETRSIEDKKKGSELGRSIIRESVVDLREYLG